MSLVQEVGKAYVSRAKRSAMSKIYLVTEGDYSDYHVCGVFSTKENAQKYIDHFGSSGGAGNSNDPDIEEFELDSDIELFNTHKPYFIKMLRDGTVKAAYEEGINDFVWRNAVDGEVNYQQYIMTTHVLATSMEHAIKVANERRTQLIALRQWREPQEVEFKIPRDFVEGVE
jgi:hypothetical protein